MNARDISIGELRALLRKSGVAATAQRLAIAAYVFSSEAHPTADDVFMAVRETLPGVSLATVYNTLNKLVDAKLIKQFQRTGERVRYDGNTEPHHHFYDVETKQLYDVDTDTVRVTLGEEMVRRVDVDRVSVYIEGRLKAHRAS